MSFDPTDSVSNPSSNQSLRTSSPPGSPVVACSREAWWRQAARSWVRWCSSGLRERPRRQRCSDSPGSPWRPRIPWWSRPGYAVDVLYAWGDPISAGPAFKPDASNTVEDQMMQAGMHHDGIHFFPLPFGGTSSTHGLLAVNHEYTDDGLLHPGGMEPWTAEKVRKSLAAHGVSVVEVRLDGGKWSVVRPSSYARRITGTTPLRLTGPAAGHPWLQTAADPAGLTVLGTLNNCAHGVTPWGTYLTCEENFNAYFVNRSGAVPALQRRYGINERGFGYRWHEHDTRFDTVAHSNEPSRFGWVVEIDPYDPQRPAVKHTALGRMKHEGAALAVARDRRVVFYMGDDERFEYVYKFVSRDPWDPARGREAGMRLLENGILYAARFNADGSGEWLELTHGKNGLGAASGFPSQAEILINTRGAADVVGATKMDRPEWVAVHPTTGEAYCALTNNVNRGKAGSPGPDPSNPRPDNVFGHIVRWRETGGDAAATRLRVGCVRPLRQSDPGRREQARQHQRRRVRLARRSLVRRARGLVDPDRRFHERPEQGRLRTHRKQPDAGGRSRHA